MIEADPVDAVAASAGVSVAELDPPLGRLLLGNEVQRSLHRRPVLSHAARLPLAIHTDIECDRVVQDGHSCRTCR